MSGAVSFAGRDQEDKCKVAHLENLFQSCGAYPVSYLAHSVISPISSSAYHS